MGVKNNKNGKYPKMLVHPNWRESKQALLIICKESPMQSVFRQTLHSSNDNLNFFCFDSFFNKNTGKKTQLCEETSFAVTFFDQTSLTDR